MAKKRTPRRREWAKETEADLERLGFNPRSPADWCEYAIVRYRDHLLITGIEKPGDPETVEVNRRVFTEDQRWASLAKLLAIALRKIDRDYRKLSRPDQRDILQYAVLSLKALSEFLTPLRIGPFGGLPTPLEILIPELLNVQEDRLSRLLTPSDEVVAAAREVLDSSKDHIRMTVQAYAAAAVKRIIESKTWSKQDDAYRLVAEALDKAGFRPPGKRKTGKYSPASIRAWYEKALVGDGLFQCRFRQAVEVTPPDPAPALEFLEKHVRSFQFNRATKRPA